MGCQRGRDSSGSGARPMGRQGSGRSGDCWGCETPMRTPTLTRQTQRLNVNIWTSLQSCCASDRLEHLKKTCVQLVWVTRGEQRKQILKCIAQICMLPLIRCWLSWLLTFHMTSTRLGLFHRPVNALLFFGLRRGINSAEHCGWNHSSLSFSLLYPRHKWNLRSRLV